MSTNPSSIRPAEPLRLELCRGASGEGCPRLLWRVPDIDQAIRRIAQDMGWAERLRELTRDRVRHHHALSVSVCGCANGCARPHVADLGLIAALTPGWEAGPCDRCGACVAACRENALTMDESGLHIDRGLCLQCGDCIAACPTGALTAQAQGYRVLLGGRLGRRPRLAMELSGLRSPEAALDILRAILGLMMRRTDPNRRLAQVLDAAGRAFLADLEIMK